VRTKHGSVLWIQERSQIVLDENGELAYVSGVFFDVTEMKLMRQELERSHEKLARTLNELRETNTLLKRTNKELESRCREINILNANLETIVKQRTEELIRSESNYRRLFEQSKDMVYISNENGEIFNINPSGLELMGYDSREDFQLLTLEDIFRDPDEACRYRQTVENQGFIKDYEVDFKKKDGTPLNMLITAGAIYDELGEFAGSEGIVKDVTQLRRVTEHLIESQKMATIGQLAAGVAHEINTPLMVILAHAQVLSDDFPEGSEVREDLKVIEEQTKICGRIVADLLDFSRQTESVMDCIDINQTIEDVLAVIEHSLNLDRIHVFRKFEPDLPTISADSEKLKQVYINMLNNAQHAIGNNGAIGITTHHSRDTREIVISFLDTGTGISPEISKRIFDPFFTTKGVGKGVGLGLSVSFGIIKDHGGYIEVESPPSPERLKVFEDENVSKRGPGTALIIHLPLT
jgi:PAS domain S-box-containing protein